MLTKTGRRLERILNLLERIAKQTAKGIPIVVEGKKDVQSLHKLDITGDIILAKSSGKSFLDVLSEIEKREINEVILLFDFDRRGKEWTRRVSQSLEKVKITPNLAFWKMLYGLVGRDLKDIEGLATYIDTLRNSSPKS